MAVALTVTLAGLGVTASAQSGATPTPTPATTPAASERRPEAGPAILEGIFKDGFTLRTPDRRNELKLQASVQLDSRFYGGDSVAPDSFDIRRARLDLNAKLHDFMAIRIQAALEDNPYIRNAFVDIGTRDAVHVRIGQMKVPFSSQWLTFDNQVDFLERGTDAPLYPFFDRGIMIWGALARQKVVYNVGVFNGSGVDADGTKGDIDDHKDVAWRLFLQPFRGAAGAAEGLYLVLQGTYGLTSAPTRRFETRGLMAATYESQVWRWRTEQVIGTDGRTTDQIAGEIDSRVRWGAEVTYKRGPLSVSAEWAAVEWDGVRIYHDLNQGSNRLRRDLVLARDGSVENVSVWASWFITGEKKSYDNFGWRQPSPDDPWGPGLPGKGAWELLARFSTTESDAGLFDTAKVSGYRGVDLGATPPPTPGEGSSVTASVLQGASTVREASLGLNWTMNYNFRVLCTYTALWAPDFVAGRDGIVSAGSSDLGDTTVRNRLVEMEHMIALRFIFRM